MSEWLTRKEAAQRLGVHARTIDRWIIEGRLEATKLTPKVVRISVWSIEQMFVSGRGLTE